MYYVTPHSPNPDCPSGEPCLTINEYAQRNHFDGDDITLLFLNGEHYLTAQNFEIAGKRSLRVAASHLRERPAIHVSSETSITILNIQEVKFNTKLRFFTLKNDDHANSSSVCLSLSDIGLLSVNRLSIESCQLLLQGEMNAAFTELTAYNSYMTLFLHQNNHTIAIRNSEFHYSSLKICDSLANSDQVITDDAITAALSLEGSSMNNSLLRVKLQMLVMYKLSVLTTSVTSLRSWHSSQTGIIIETFAAATLYTLFQHCTIAGNYHGIHITAGGDSCVELDVDQCYIANNSHVSEPYYYEVGLGGITVHQLKGSNTVTNTNIISTVLSGNSQRQISVVGYSGTASVTVFNSTITDTLVAYGCDGALFYMENNRIDSNRMFLNFTLNHFEVINIHIEGQNCVYEVHFVSNVVKYNGAKALLRLASSKNSVGKVNIAHCFFATSTRAIVMLYPSSSLMVRITQTIFAQNEVGIWIDNLKHSRILIEDSIFQEHVGLSLQAQGQKVQYVSSKPIEINLKNVTFLNNKLDHHFIGIIQVDSTVHLSIGDSCVFRGNQGSVIQALATTVTLSGVVIFEDNVATHGAAMLLKSSMLRLESINGTNTSIQFVNNTATDTGGGIYIDQSLNTDFSSSFWASGSGCFYEIQGETLEGLEHSLLFINNTATNGGTNIYGATPNSMCEVDFIGPWPTGLYFMFSFEIKDYIFKTSSSISSISSDPKRVCLCDSFSQLMCASLSHIFYNTTRYPGEVFSLSLAVVGFEFGTVTGPVYANLLPQANNSISSLENGQHVRLVNYNGCTQLNFSVSSFNSKETIVLTAIPTKITKQLDSHYVKTAIARYFDYIPFELLTIPVYIEVKFLPDCPPGFQQTNLGKCDCVGMRDAIGCSIQNNTAYITRTGNIWIKPTSSHHIIYSKHCPFYYCKHLTINLNLSDPDKQCAFNHTGILCGACPSNLSLAIGSSRCLKCSDDYHLLLLIAFAAAGVVLVLFIKILDVTVSIGTICGLIFYANIVWANQSVLFPPQDQTSSLLQFLKVLSLYQYLMLSLTKQLRSSTTTTLNSNVLTLTE